MHMQGISNIQSRLACDGMQDVWLTKMCWMVCPYTGLAPGQRVLASKSRPAGRLPSLASIASHALVSSVYSKGQGGHFGLT
jgi:hypothetical protein